MVTVYEMHPCGDAPSSACIHRRVYIASNSNIEIHTNTIPINYNKWVVFKNCFDFMIFLCKTATETGLLQYVSTPFN